jgi:hypothetical protein
MMYYKADLYRSGRGLLEVRTQRLLKGLRKTIRLEPYSTITQPLTQQIHNK